jgi:hypothetical protein
MESGIVTKEWRVENRVAPTTTFEPGMTVAWKTMFGEWMTGRVVEVREASLIVDRTSPSGAPGLELQKADVV